jgi:hypothetical protein
MQQCGIVTGGFENPPFSDMLWNAPHLPELLKECGYEPFFPSTTFEVDLTKLDPESLLSSKVKQLQVSNEYEWSSIRLRTFKRDIEDTRKVLNDGFDQNPMFVPLTSDEMLFQAKDMMYIVDERISSIVRKGSDPVGVVVCIPDLNPLLRSMKSEIGALAPFHYLRYRMNRKRAIVIFWSVVRSEHGKGLAPSMLHQMIKSLKDAGYEKLGLTWIADENTGSLKTMEKLKARALHRTHLFRRSL